MSFKGCYRLNGGRYRLCLHKILIDKRAPTKNLEQSLLNNEQLSRSAHK